MNRIPLYLAALLGALMPLVFDSALKGAALLAVAALCALSMWRGSAATRHLVWLVAVVALLIVPVLSFALPQWRILPQWTASPLAEESVAPPASIGNGTHESYEAHASHHSETPPLVPPQTTIPDMPPAATPLPPGVPAAAAPVSPLPSPEPAGSWRDWLPLAWAAGFAFLALRLFAAHLLLRRAARSCTALTAPPDGSIAGAFEVARRQLGIRQHVTLLLDGKRTIPVVWGVFRPRLVLPAEAREWNEEQLRSVLLHELAHIKRRDALVQWITQIACALHWFNPLVWLAAWRLHAERERACDDLVLASGVRPSAYAEHLLHVATRLSPARWTAACGLAMARKSSLEGRLLAVLSEKLNRRGLTRALTAAALLLAAAVAIPIAMLRAADEKTEAKTGAKLQPDTVAKLKWGEPVNGLRMALAFPPALKDALLGEEAYFQLVVQNASEKAVRFTTGDDAPNPRSMQWREGERIVQALSDKDAQKTDWNLAPGECGVLRLFTKEERGKDGKTISALLDKDLAGGTRYHVICIMEIAKAPAGAWTGKLITGETRGSADTADAPVPVHKDARALYEIWQRHARTNGDIPGALIGELAIGVRRFIHYNPTWETVPKLNEILTRLDATRDWKSADAIALLDEVAAVKDSPLDMALSDENDRVIVPGQPLPKELADKPWIWSQADPGGLRIGWDLEPRGEPALMTSKEENWISSHALGTALGARLFVHNTSDKPVIVRLPTWHQGGVTAVNKDAAEIEVSGIEWTTLASLVTHRLAPGEYIAIRAPGVGFGKDAGRGPWAGPRVGWNVTGQPGDLVRLTHAPLSCDASHVGRREVDPIEDGPAWWTEFVKARLARGLTAPSEKSDAITLPAPADRAQLLDSACRDLFGTAPTAAERTAFDAVKSRATLFIFAEKLAQRPGITSFDGTLTPPHAWFEILKPDPAADKTPRVVLGPGEYPLSAGTAEYGAVTLKIVGRSVGDRRTNDAQLLFDPVEFTGALPPDPHQLEVPDGWGTWAIVCRPGEGFFYILHKGGARKIDYTKPREVTDTPATDLPAEFRAEVKRQLNIHEVSAESQAEIFGTAAAPAATPAPKTATASPRADEAQPRPKHETAQSLFKNWLASARTDGKIPGGLIGLLAEQVDVFIKQSPSLEATPKLAAVRPKLDASRDWTQAEAVAVLDEITGISTAPVGWADIPWRHDMGRNIRRGAALPKELESVAWGTPAENGLRAAWLLEPTPRVAWASIMELHYPLGTVLKARVLFHNTGKAPVVFQTETWHQGDGHKARDAKGAEIPVKTTWFTGITPMATFRLLPGEYCEVSGHGIAIGAGEYAEERSIGTVGAIIEAKEGDDVTLTHTVDAAQGGWTKPNDPKDPAELRKRIIAERVEREAPMPPAAADREQLIRRVTLDLTGVAPSAEEIAAFTADDAPDALEKLIARLQAKPADAPWSGKLPTGETKFRVIAADPNAAKAPRTATAPGRYVLGDGVHLQVHQVTENGTRTNSAEILFLSPDPSDPKPYEIAPPKPHNVALPDGLGTYGIVWERGAGVLWTLGQKGLVRKYDFTNPNAVKESRFESGGIINIPEHLREAMKKAFDVPGAPERKQMPVEPKDGAAAQPNGGAKLDARTEAQLDWGEAVNGLRGAVVIRGEPQGIYLAVQNVSPAPLRFTDTVKAKDLRKFYPSDAKGILFAFTSDEPTHTDVLLYPREVAYLRMLPPLKEGDHSPEAGLIEGIRKDALQTWAMVLQIAAAPEGAWKGKLITADSRCALREGGPQPKNASAQALFKHWQSNARLNGDIPGGLVRLLHEKVKEFIRANEPDASGGPFAQKMKPLEPRFANAGDWKAADVVALLDDIAAAHTIPLDNALTHLAERTLYPGTPLPASLEKTDWGEPLPSGLRVAHLLEPRAGAYHLGTELKARIIFHNTGSQHVEFITDTFQQPGYSAKRADGSDIKLDGVTLLTLGSMAAYRLAPGEYCEVHTPGLGIGAQVKGREDWVNVRAGSWILCAAGDEVVVTPGAAALSYHETPEQKADWWLAFITERLNREAPVPLDTKEREYLLYRVVRELYGTAPSTTEGDAFAADKSPDALKNLAALLAKHPYGKRSDGLIQAGSTKFRVLPPDADADKRPRVATGAGMFSLGDGVNFYVTQRAASNSVRNDASIVYYQQGKDAVVHKVPLPYGHDRWAAATMKGAKELWVAEFGTLRKYDFADPHKPAETRYEGGKLSDAPISKELRAALDPVLSKPAVAPKPKHPGPPPASAPATEKPKGAAVKLTPDMLLGTWRGTVNEEKLMLSFHRPPVEKDVQCDIYFGEATIGVLAGFTIAEDGGSAEVVQHSAGGGMKFGTLIPGEAGKLKLELYGRQKGQQELMLTRDADAAATEPQQKEARELFEMWKRTANDDGTIPGTFIGALATEVRAYVKAHPNYDSAMKLPKLLPRFVTSRDWTQAEAIKLLDDVAYYSTAPIEALLKKAGTVTPPAGRTAEQIVESVRTNLPGLPPLQGTLRTNGSDTPFTIEVTGPVMRLRFENPARELVLTLGAESAELKDSAGAVRSGERILDSELTFGDLSMRYLYWPEKKLIGQETIQTRRCDVVDCHNPDPQDDCMMVRLFVNRDPGLFMPVMSGTIMRMNCYNRDGKLTRSYSITSAMKMPDLRGETAVVVKSMEVVRYEPGAKKVAGSTTLTLKKPQVTAAGGQQQEPARSSDAKTGDDTTSATVEGKPADDFTAARFYEKRGNHAAALIYYSGVLNNPGSPHHNEARAGIARLVAADPTLAEKAAKSRPKLTPETEAQLDWSEAVNGLRAAVLVWAPRDAKQQGICLVVQNVSQGPLRFADTAKSKDLRKLYLSDSKGILMGLGSDEPTQTDVQLQPREVAYLRMMPPLKEGEQSVEAALIEGLRKDSLQTWRIVLQIEKAPEGAWTGKLTTGETRGAVSAHGPQPKTKEGQALFKLWQDSARLNGDIPGGLLSRLHDKVREFIRNNSGDASGDPYAKKMAPLEARFGAAGDWKPADVVALMDDIAAVTSIPLEVTLEHIQRNTLQHGQPLPAAYAKADWGEPLEGGLRMAFVLEPRAGDYHLGTEVKARIVLHNSGKEPVAFVTSGFQQPGHKAKLAGGGELKLDSTFWTTLGRPNAYRLAPGEYCEVYTPGLGIGEKNKDHDDWSNVRAGSWIFCSEGDEVIVTPGAALLARRDEQPDKDNWWLEFITERLNREAPVPLDTKEREYLLYRVVRELFGTAPSTTEGDAFAADKSPDALKNLAVLLTKHAYGKQCHGMIHAGETKFRVLPPDPDAAKKPRVAMNPGYYTLSDAVRFSVTRRTAGGRTVNDGSVIYFQPGKDNVVHDLKLSDGYGTWAAGWAPGTTVLWVSQKGLLRSCDFTDPATVKETRYEGDKTATAPIPADVRKALSTALRASEAPKQIQQPLPPAAAPPASEK